MWRLSQTSRSDVEEAGDGVVAVIVCVFVIDPRVEETIAHPAIVGDKVNGNVALTEPTGTATVAGTVNPALVDLTDTTSALDGAVVKVIEHVPLCPGASDAGEQANKEREVWDGERIMGNDTAACPTWARTVEFCAVLITPAPSGKLADVEPAGTVSEADNLSTVGTVVDNNTWVPPVGASRVS